MVYYNKGKVTYTDNYVNGKLNSRVSNEDFINPLPNSYVTCPFGCYSGHTGIDLQTSGKNGKVLAAASGKVVVSGTGYGYGNHVVINHGNGYCTLYAHMDKASSYKVGDYVVQGNQLGVEGATGNVTGPHLHFEVSKNGYYQNQIDPAPLLP